jgi:hypothetical protein
VRAPQSLRPDVLPPQMPAVDVLSPFREKQLQKENQRSMEKIGLV